MAHDEAKEKKQAAAKFEELMKKFGDTLGEILEDPELRKQAKQFGMAVVDAAAKVAETKMKDVEVKNKFRDVGKAAQSFGKSLETHFTPEKS
ncbi:MAG: hypothetical protein PHE50_09825 [Dehalococcoidales bacterium]|nr:hypothetical protein [Dehalococcoidales bacterium]